MLIRTVGNLARCHACCLWAWAAILALTGAAASQACAAGRLISREQARHLGLERAWFSQVRLDHGRSRVERAILSGNRLDVLTSAGVVHEFNAQTGETVWVASVGNPNYPSLGPSATESHVALVNGSTLYVLDRTDGRPVRIHRVGGAPGAAPALAQQRVLVPLVSGRIESYPLDKEVFAPASYQSQGRAMVAPLTTAQGVVWSTDTGQVYVGRADEMRVRFRLETDSDIVAQAAYRKPYIYIAATSGEVFAVDEMTGAKRWKYATGYPILRAPATVGDSVFVTSAEPALHCVSADTGAVAWEALDVAQFSAASRTRVYGVDVLGQLVVLDAATGSILSRMKTDGSTNTLVNDQTDRLYLVSDDGMVQCLHEIGAKEPLNHNPQEAMPAEGQPATGDAAASAPTASPPPQQPGAAAQPSVEASPFGAPAADEGNPFGDEPSDATEPGMEAEEPVESPPAEAPPSDADDDPFSA